MTDFQLVPARTALINVDMQRCFVEGSPLASPDGLSVLARINRLAAACRDAGILIVHTRGWMRPDGQPRGDGQTGATLHHRPLHRGRRRG